MRKEHEVLKKFHVCRFRFTIKKTTTKNNIEHEQRATNYCGA